MSKLEDLAAQKLSQMFDVLGAAMPKITQGVLDVVHYNCLSWVILAQIWGLVFFLFLGLSVLCVYKREYAKEKWEDLSDSGFSCFCICATGVSLVLWVVANINCWWEWIGMNHPDVYLIHQAMKAVGAL